MNATTRQTGEPPGVRTASLIVRASSRAFAIPIPYVVETMRPLPIDPIAGVPTFLLGLSVIRGAPVPVVDLGAVAGLGRGGTVSRFVTLRLGERRVALAVGAVVGMRDLVGVGVGEMPPLLREASADVIEAIGVLDAQLLLVLRASRLLPEEIWQKLSSFETPS
jgi:purine-binding chemotaxis protein CheW